MLSALLTVGSVDENHTTHGGARCHRPCHWDSPVHPNRTWFHQGLSSCPQPASLRQPPRYNSESAAGFPQPRKWGFKGNHLNEKEFSRTRNLGYLVSEAPVLMVILCVSPARHRDHHVMDRAFADLRAVFLPWVSHSGDGLTL